MIVGLAKLHTKVSIIRNMLRVHWTKTNHRNRGIHVFNNALQWNFVIIELIGHFVEIDYLFQQPFTAGQAIMKSTVGWLVYTSSELMYVIQESTTQRRFCKSINKKAEYVFWVENIVIGIRNVLDLTVYLISPQITKKVHVTL